MAWARWLAAGLALLDAGYMALDGARALTKGDYFTPQSGEHAGELGPWAKVVQWAGVEPRSTGMKAFFVVYGLAWIGVVAAFALGHSWSWAAMLALAAGSSWYLTVGTILSVTVSILLLLPAVRDVYSV